MNDLLCEWNGMEGNAAVAAILPCNGSRRWAMGVGNARPFRTPEALFAISDEVWRGLPQKDWLEAFESHPRIGETHAARAGDRSLAWSAGEQSAANPDEAIKALLADGNRAYEARFGRVFLVCATGKSAAEMLAILQNRLGNESETELREAVEQQRRITQLRLRKWLRLPAASCEAV